MSETAEKVPPQPTSRQQETSGGTFFQQTGGAGFFGDQTRASFFSPQSCTTTDYPAIRVSDAGVPDAKSPALPPPPMGNSYFFEGMEFSEDVEKVQTVLWDRITAERIRFTEEFENLARNLASVALEESREHVVAEAKRYGFHTVLIPIASRGMQRHGNP